MVRPARVLAVAAGFTVAFATMQFPTFVTVQETASKCQAGLTVEVPKACSSQCPGFLKVVEKYLKSAEACAQAAEASEDTVPAVEAMHEAHLELMCERESDYLCAVANQESCGTVIETSGTPFTTQTNCVCRACPQARWGLSKFMGAVTTINDAEEGKFTREQMEAMVLRGMCAMVGSLECLQPETSCAWIFAGNLTQQLAAADPAVLLKKCRSLGYPTAASDAKRRLRSPAVA